MTISAHTGEIKIAQFPARGSAQHGESTGSHV